MFALPSPPAYSRANGWARANHHLPNSRIASALSPRLTRTDACDTHCRHFRTAWDYHRPSYTQARTYHCRTTERAIKPAVTRCRLLNAHAAYLAAGPSYRWASQRISCGRRQRVTCCGWFTTRCYLATYPRWMQTTRNSPPTCGVLSVSCRSLRAGGLSLDVSNIQWCSIPDNTSLKHLRTFFT